MLKRVLHVGTKDESAMGPGKKIRQLGVAPDVATTTTMEPALEKSRRDPERERTCNVNHLSSLA